MARNEEKQQGRLNRLWLQKEREEGRLKDKHERRPKLSTLNSVSCVKKWIPSIKKEIEYYLQQSQLSHYPERKIAEFQLQIEALEKEYKSFITKLRVLDPTCKHKPWTPRAYCKRRVESSDCPSSAKTRRLTESHDGDSSQMRGGGGGLFLSGTGSDKNSTTDRRGPLGDLEGGFASPAPTTNPDSGSPQVVSADQDQPLSFDRARLAVATAAFRGASDQQGFFQTLNLAKMLQASLPNLSNSQRGQTLSPQRRDARDNAADEHQWDCDASCPGTAHHLPGLDCYSSSDEES